MNRILATALLALSTVASAQQKPVIIGYVRGPGRLIAPADISARKVTRLHYAFLHPLDGKIPVTPSDETNLRTLIALKHDNPSLEVLVSLGGGAHSSGFSPMLLTPEGRASFVARCMELIATYSLDGIDIDWEYPGAAFPGQPTHAAEDKTNYTLLFHDLREAFTAYENETHHKHLILSTATNGKPFFVRATDLGAASQYLDTIALMGYDIYGHGSPTTGHESSLFTSANAPQPFSDDNFVHVYLAAGVPASKIVLGVPFYGYVWHNVSALNDGLFQPSPIHSARDEAYNKLVKNELLPGSGYIRHWDDTAKVPFLYNPRDGTFISYEDPESIAAKADYVRAHGLGGMMFWEYSYDSDNILLDAINTSLNPKPTKTTLHK